MSDKTIPVYPDKCSDAVWQPRRKTHAVKIQNGPVTVTVGGGAPVVVQSMTNTATENVADTVEQVKALAQRIGAFAGKYASSSSGRSRNSRAA